MARPGPAMMAPASASGALAGSRGSHPTMRMDSFLRATDATYHHADTQATGDCFIRKMATYGHVRPSVSFTNVARVARPMEGHQAMDMSSLPSPFLDPRGEDKEGTLAYPQPPAEIDNSYIKLYENQSLMMPSERYKEHLALKEAEAQWREDRYNLFRYRKRINVLERHYPNGVVGVDGPMFPNTQLYKERRQHLVSDQGQGARSAVGRTESLSRLERADDATACRHYGSDPQLARSRDLGIQRKRVDPEAHPFRFHDTHDRLFPKFSPTWDPERAGATRSHETRGRQHCIISGADNHIEMKVATSWDAPPLPGMPNAASRVP